MNKAREKLGEALEPILGSGLRIESLDPYRQVFFQGLVAGHALNRRFKPDSGERMLVVLLSKLSERARTTVAHLQEMLPDHSDIVLVDSFGNSHGPISVAEEEAIREAVLALDLDQGKKKGGSFFTQNNVWLLKILLMDGLDRSYWGGPQLDRFPQSRMLERVSGLSQAAVSRFFSIGSQHGYVTRESHGVQFHNLRRLFEEWAFVHHQKFRLLSTVDVSPLYPDDTILELIGRDPDACILAGHSAARHLRIGRTNVDTPLAYVPSIVDTMTRFELAPVTPSSEGERITLAEPKRFDLLKMGAVEIDNRFMVTDAIQTYLDLYHSLNRGREQAEFIFERVFEEHFRSRRWL